MTIKDYKTEYGVIHHSSTCKDDFKNIVTRRRRRPSGLTVPSTEMTLQEPAILSIRAAEKELSKPWKPFYVRVTGTIRTCEQQMDLWQDDKDRFAHPNDTLHTQGLAIDVHTGYLSEELRRTLLKHGWHQSRPDDEPWHFSMRLTG